MALQSQFHTCIQESLGKVKAGVSPDQSKQLPFHGGLPRSAHLPQDPEVPALILLVAAPRPGVSRVLRLSTSVGL